MDRKESVRSAPRTVATWRAPSIWWLASAARLEGAHDVRLPALAASSRLAQVTLWLGAGLMIAGCGLGPPERFPTAEVRGVVVEAGRPVGGGWIVFIPFDGAVGNQRSAPIASDGSFHAERVAVGLNSMRVVNAPIQLPRGRQLFESNLSPLRRVIPAEASGPLTIDLVEEALRYQARQPERPRYDFEPTPTPGGEGSR